MTPVSHALLPVFFGQKLISHRDGVPSFLEVSIVAFCGVLPDILSPHLSLESRYTALSHTVYALGIFIVLIGIASIFSRLLRRLSILCILAYAGHIACDMISGGVALFYPQRIHVYGDAYMPHWLWITSDGLLLLYLYLVYRWLPLRRRIKEKSALIMIAAADNAPAQPPPR